MNRIGQNCMCVVAIASTLRSTESLKIFKILICSPPKKLDINFNSMMAPTNIHIMPHTYIHMCT